MAKKDLGSLHKYLDPEGRAFEEVVFQQGKGGSSSEVVQLQELRQQQDARQLQSAMPSGFVTGHMERAPMDDFRFWDPQVNQNFGPDAFKLTHKPIVHVNGWVIPLEYTNTTEDGANVVDNSLLNAPPASTGEFGVDFVFLEVWRALIKPDPDSTHKPQSDKLYHHGNILSPSGVWLDDNLKDNPISSQTGNPTSLRVQIQYRFRSVRLSNDANRMGYNDANVFAQGPNGSPTSQTFTHAPAASTQDNDDIGLWIAGDTVGQNNAISGTVDGFVYSIPVCLVYRRNSNDFDFLNNGNGATTGAGTQTDSNRPDGYYSDQVVEDDIQDIRRSVQLADRDWNDVQDQHLHDLLDHSHRTWMMDSSTTDWYVGGTSPSVGTTILRADDLIPDGAGDPGSGNTIRSPDGVCRTFSDRSHIETYLATYSTGSAWSDGDVLQLDFTPSGQDVQKHQPSGTAITDVRSVRLNDASGSQSVPPVSIDDVDGLGTGTVNVTLGVVPFSSTADLWIDFEVTYPPGSGLTKHVTRPTSEYQSTTHNPSEFNNLSIFSVTWTDDDDPNTGRPAFRDQVVVNYETGPHREVSYTFHGDPSNQVADSTYIINGNEFLMPERPWVPSGQNPNNYMDVAVNGNSETVDAVNRRRVTLKGSFSDGDPVDVAYVPHRPIPANGSKHTLYYRSEGIQAIPEEYLPSQLDVTPLAQSDQLYVTTTGSGSLEEAFPYPNGFDQIPVSTSVDFDGDEDLGGPSVVSIDDFEANTGFAQLPVFVPIARPNQWTFHNPVNVGGSPSGNDEFIDHYAGISSGSHRPALFAQTMTLGSAHKVFYPLLVRLEEDTSFAKKGEVILVVLSHYEDHINGGSPRQNHVVSSDDGFSAALYLLQGRMHDVDV